MRKFLIAIVIILIAFSSRTNIISLAESSRYARVEKSTEIYKNPNDNNDIKNIICLAEQSYFVKIIGDYENYFRVYYNDINGYVKKNDVKEITNTPSTPYPFNIKLTIANNCNLRSSPTTKSNNNNILTTLYANETNFTFIGRVFSEEAIDFGGSTWYYVNYNGTYGYIYNQYISSITPIYSNTDEFTYLTQQEERIKNPITHTPSLIIIILLLLPCIAVLLILYLPTKKQNKAKIKKIPKIFDRY